MVSPGRIGWRAAVTGLAALGLFVTPPASGQVSVSARFEPDRVSLDGTTELVVDVVVEEARASIETPVLPSLRGLDLVGTARDSGVRLDGTRVTRHASHRYRLRALRAGTIRLGVVEVTVDGTVHRARPSALEVAPNARSGAARLRLESETEGPPPIFATTRVDRQSVYVGQQLTLTFAFYHDPRVGLAESPDYDPPGTPGFWRVELDREPETTTERIGGRVYHVQRYRYGLFPLRAGLHTIGSARVRVTEPDPGRWWRPGRARTIETRPLEVVAESLPGGAPRGFDGAVGRYRLSGGIRETRVASGVPVELELTVHGIGNPTAVPPPRLPEWPDAEIRPPDVASDSEVRALRVRGRKTFRWLVVPETPGRWDLGVARLPYFDPAAGRYVVDTLRLGEIDVAAGPPGTAMSGISRQARDPTLWPAREPRSPSPRGLAAEPWYWIALAGPWLAWLGLFGVTRLGRRLGTGAANRPEDRLARVRRDLAAGRDVAREAAAAIDHVLAARYGVHVAAGDGPLERGERMRSAGVPPAIVATAEEARDASAALAYGSGTAADAEAAMERFETALGTAPRTRRPVTGVVAILAAGTLLTGWTSTDRPGADEAAWAAANRAYRAGEFVTAAATYRRLLERVDDPHLEADLAAALWRAGSRGAAVAHYRRALASSPRERTIRADLRRLTTELGEPPSIGEGPPPFDRIRLDELLLALLVAGWAAAIALAVARRRPRVRLLARSLIAATVVLAAASGVDAVVDADRQPRAILVEDAAIAARPGGAAMARLSEGAEVEVLDRGADAWRVRTGGSPAGWVAREKLVPLD